jgi:hypothetical protein
MQKNKLIMTANESLNLSLHFKELVTTDLSHVFQDHIPVDLIEEWVRKEMPQSRDCIFTPTNMISSMLLSAIQEDKSLQQSLNVFKLVFESRSQEILLTEEALLEEEKNNDAQNALKAGRPKKYKSKLPKSYQQPISTNTAGYSIARKRLDKRIFETVYAHSTDFGEFDKESWHGMKTVIGDGTYLQLQDTEDIKSQYVVKGQEDSYPQALLQVMIRQGTGQIAQYALGCRHESELLLVIPMIKKLKKNYLLLADDLYNTYYHFCLILQQQCHMIVPGKRNRNYKEVRNISENDQIVEISKTVRPDYVSKEEWEKLPKTILLRRISYTYPTKNGMETAILYTTVLNEKITAADIVAKYTMRWDIEISIREIKTLMDINILRSKSREMLFKELIIALTAYNMVRKIIAGSADKVGFSPQRDIFQKCSPFGRTVLLDKKGRVFFKWSPGRYGYTDGSNCTTSDTTPKRKKTTLHPKNETWKI